MPSASRMTFGTCIVAIRTPNEVILGADSLERYSRGRDEEVCKIVRVGNIVFAVAGVRSVEDHYRRVDVAEVVRQALTSESSIADSLAKSRLVFEKRTKDYFNGCEEEDKLHLLACLKGREIEVVVCGMEDDSPNLSVMTFNLKPPFKDMDFSVQTENIGASSSERVPYFAGHCKNRYERAGLDMTGDLVSIVKRLIHDVIMVHERGKESERWCGGPIRIVRVGRSGIKWEPGDEVCD